MSEMKPIEEAPGHPEILRLVADNPGPMTLTGTNTYLYGNDPCWVIDPGPEDQAHIDAVKAAVEPRGGLGGTLLTHSHNDHSGGLALFGHDPALIHDGEVIGGLEAVATPGHATDHFCFFTDDGVCFSGDLILGWGSTYVPPDGGSLAAYMDSLRLVVGRVGDAGASKDSGPDPFFGIMTQSPLDDTAFDTMAWGRLGSYRATINW